MRYRYWSHKRKPSLLSHWRLFSCLLFQMTPTYILIQRGGWGEGSTINVVFFSLFDTWTHWWCRRLFELLKWLGNGLIWDQNFIFYFFMFKLVNLCILNYWPNVKLQKRYREKYSLLYQQSRSLIFVYK